MDQSGAKRGQFMDGTMTRNGMARAKGAGPFRLPFQGLRSYWPVLALMLTALVIRAPIYGNPDYHLDEEFYLLVGDRMWQGWLPYVDIWDRKPIGLFLIYAFARAFGGEGVVQYQLLASLCAGGTAALIWAMARRHSGSFAGMAAGVAYLFWLILFSGGAGQSPVFYNLLIAAAAWSVLRAQERADSGYTVRLSLWAMLACGVTLQIKYTALPEGVFIGCWFLWLLWRQGMGAARIAGHALVMALVALAPTLLAVGFYAAIGHLDAFLYANIFSVFHRGYLGDDFMARAWDFFSRITIPLGIAIAFGLMTIWPTARRDHVAFMLGWLAAAIAGFAMIGNYYDHYFIPVLPPAFVLAAAALRRTPVGMGMTAVLIGWAAIGHFPDTAFFQRQGRDVRDLARATAPYVQGRCLFIYDGPSAVYLLTNACIPTRYVYPDHLSNAVERHAIGVDPVAEMRRVLASRPGAIITANVPNIPHVNKDTAPMVLSALARDYVCVAAVKTPVRTFYVHALRQLVPGTVRPLRCRSDYSDGR